MTGWLVCRLDVALEQFRSTFCMRCFIYHCPLHSAPSPTRFAPCPAPLDVPCPCALATGPGMWGLCAALQGCCSFSSGLVREAAWQDTQFSCNSPTCHSVITHSVTQSCFTIPVELGSAPPADHVLSGKALQSVLETCTGTHHSFQSFTTASTGQAARL